VIGIFRSHRTNDLFSRPERPCYRCEILNIGTGAVENLLCFVIAGFGFFVAGNDNSGMKMLDDTNARDPLVPLSRSSEREHLVDLIVSDVAGVDVVGENVRLGSPAITRAALVSTRSSSEDRLRVIGDAR